MEVSIGTFNLNNLFSRFNFEASVSELREANPGEDDVTVSYIFDTSSDYALRSFQGRLIHGKDADETAEIAQRIIAMDADVLAVQEVESMAVLKEFNKTYLGDRYDHVALVEGNDGRLIDVGVLSKLPLGLIMSNQTAVHPDAPYKRVFSRDLLGVEILDPTTRKKLFTLYNTHLKSHYVSYWENEEEGQRRNNERRRQQAEMISQLIGAIEYRGGKYVLTGDMNDPVDSPYLAPMLTIDGEPLVNAVANPIETRPPKTETEGPGPQTTAWSYRYNPRGPELPFHHLYDQIWLSQAMAPGLKSAHVDRRTKHSGDGSDHDPVWVVLEV